MANGNGGGSSNVAIVVIFILIIVAAGAGFFLWRGGYFGGAKEKTNINIDIKVPSGAPPKPY
jgi:hypothetical protein